MTDDSSSDALAAGSVAQEDVLGLIEEAKRLQSDAAKLKQNVEKESDKSEEIDNRIKGMRAEEETEVRKFVTKTVISGYGSVIVGSIILVVLVFFAGGKTFPTELGEWLHDLLLATVLPVVTLVLGYYFGSSSK